MNLHEYQGKELFGKYNLPVSKGIVIDDPENALKACRDIGGSKWVVKAQVHAGGRGKSGGVVLVENPDDAREFAKKWIDVHIKEFKRLGVTGDFKNYYSTMSYDAEAQIVRELGKFLKEGSLYRGFKPVLWSTVEKTALADAEVEYQDHKSDTIYTSF